MALEQKNQLIIPYIHMSMLIWKLTIIRTDGYSKNRNLPVHFLKIIQSVDFAKREIPVNNVSRKTQKYDIHCLPSSFKIVI